MADEVLTESSTVTAVAETAAPAENTDTSNTPAESTPATPNSEADVTAKSGAESESAEIGERGKVHPTEKRVKQLLAEVKELKAQQRAQTYSGLNESPRTELPKAPNPEEFTDWKQYESAKEEHTKKLIAAEVERAVIADRQARAQEAAKREMAEQARVARESWTKKVADASKRHPGLNAQATLEKIQAARFPVIDQFLFNSKIGVDLAVHLEKDPEALEAIQEAEPFDAFRRLHEVETTLLAQIKGIPTKEAPKPPSTVAGTASPRVARPIWERRYK